MIICTCPQIIWVSYGLPTGISPRQITVFYLRITDVFGAPWWIYINLCPCLFSHRYHRLRELNKVLQNTPASLKEPHRVRWLSLQEAVVAVSRCWPALVGVFGEEAVNGNAVAHGPSKKVEDFLFVGYTQIFMDALPVITRLSKVLQKELVDYDQFQTQLNATKATVAMMADDDSLDSMPHLKAFMDIPQDEDGLIIHSGIPLIVLASHPCTRVLHGQLS